MMPGLTEASAMSDRFNTMAAPEYDLELDDTA